MSMSMSETMPTELGSTQHIEHLPDDILVEIFLYLSLEDLVESVYHVSSRFKYVAQDSRLWRKLKYKPAQNETDDEMVNIFLHAPKLQKLELDNRIVGSSVLCAILENCSDLRKLTFSMDQRSLEQSLKSMAIKWQELEHLTIPLETVNTLEAAEMIGQFQKLKTLNIISNYERPTCSVWLRPIGDGCPLLQHLDISCCQPHTADLKYFMKMKHHQLQSINVPGYYMESGEQRCIIPLLTECNTLTKLTVDCYLDKVTTLAGYEALTTMKNISSLSFAPMYTTDVTDLVNLFSNGGMSHLIELKFSIYYSYDDILSETVCNNCPLLKVLQFNIINNMTEKSLANLHKLKALEYLVLCSHDVTDVGIGFVCKCGGLKHLTLSGCSDLTEKSLNHLVNLNMLQTLILVVCNIEGFPLGLIPSRLTKLRLLSIDRCKGVNLEEVQQLRTNMPLLTVRVREVR